MCGIHLIIDKTLRLQDQVIHNMAELTRYRGPDETKVKIIKTPELCYHLAVNRLKITDHSENSSQPYFSENGRYALLFNGEIYNYYTLKNELLSRGISFQSNSDTEVLLSWLVIFGQERIHELKGMFAFIFIDFNDNEFFIARDALGIKPVYYYQDEKYLIVSSEINPIVRTGLFKIEIPNASIYAYLQLKYVPGSGTFYENVFELAPGHLLSGDSKSTGLVQFARPKPPSINTVPDITEIKNLLHDSLLQQINTPVPLGLLLSGGVDSTLLLATAHREGFSLPTFSIVHAEKDSAFGTLDYKYAKKAAQTFGGVHHELEVNISIFDRFDDFIKKLDQPIGDSAYLMTSEVCKVAANTMKVLLSGAGADELFGGYNRHWAFYHYLQHRKSLQFFNPLIRFSARVLPTGFRHPLRKQFRLLKKMALSHHSSPARTFGQFLRFQEIPFDARTENLPEFNNNSDWMGWALNHDLKNYLVQDVLALSDRASMLHGIELRVPYLDQDLVEHVNGIKPEAIMKNGRKWILKTMLTNYGGKEFADRPKEGFGLPLSRWLMDKKVAHLWEFSKKKGHPVFEYIHKPMLERLIDNHHRKVEDHGQFLWSVLVLAHWLERHLQ